MFSRTSLTVKEVKRMNRHLSVPSEWYERYSQRNRRTCGASSSKKS